MEKVEVAEIHLYRWGREGATVCDFPAANDVLRQWAYELKEGETEYIDVYVEWQDRRNFRTRFDLLADSRTGVHLGLHVQNNIAFKAGEWRPSNVTPETYEQMVDQFREEGLVEQHMDLLDHYQLK